MTNQSPNNMQSGGHADSSLRQSSEPYINELIPVEPSRPRRRADPEPRGR